MISPTTIAPPEPTTAPLSLRVVALVGNPNCGKTTVFNALTGLRQKVANYPGVTVERREGTLALAARRLVLIDLPGTYSLSPRAPDERVTRDVLLGRQSGAEAPDAVLIVIDASNLERNLYLATQVLDLGLPTVVACNMIDVAEARGDHVDVVRLAAGLGAPVVPMVATRREGLDALRSALESLTAPERAPLPLPPSLAGAAERLGSRLVEAGRCGPASAAGLARILLSTPPPAPGLPGGAEDGLAAAAHESLRQDGCEDPVGAIIDARYAWITELVGRVVSRSASARRGDQITDRLDRVLTHKVAGMAVFIAVMAAMFASIFWLAEPFVGLIESALAALQAGVRQVAPAGPAADLLADGVLGGVGAVVTFFPQICILFIFIALLEDSGYIARAAFLMDRVMYRVGLSGRSFIPLLSSFACAVPGIMATRTIEDRRDRLATILVAPLIGCPARLPIYIIVAEAVFGPGAWRKAGIILGLYLLGGAAAFAMAGLLKRSVLRGPTPTFIMELPPYHLPRPGVIVRMMWDRAKLFLSRAGTIILAVSVILWALQYFPRTLAAADGDRGDQLESSCLGRLGRAVAPVLEPLGFDWKVSVGVLASFAAREVFVSTMAVVYHADEDDQRSLRDRMQAARWESGPRNGRRVFTPAAGLSLMVFYALCCQCVSTLAVARRETNSWRWPAFMFVYMTVLAYLASLGIYQAGRWLGWDA